MSETKVLIVGAECIPFAKTGGLADVVGTLPSYLKRLGADVRVMLPFHSGFKWKYDEKAELLAEFRVWLGWRNQYCGIRQLKTDGITYYFIDNDFYFGGPIYKGGEEEGEQYAFFSKATLEAVEQIGFLPDVLHCNDWHTAMIPMLIKTQYQNRPQGQIKTLLTIHNIMYQGKYRFDFVKDVLGVEERYLTQEYMESYGCANFLKAGLVFADKINTVSPNYAKELTYDYFAHGLGGILRARSHDLLGIVNGIDNEEYNPQSDPLIAYPFSAHSLTGKQKNKVELLKRLGMQKMEGRPLLGMVTRLTAQKGIDLILRIFPEIMEEDIAVVLLGSGDAFYENCFRELEVKYKGKFCAYIGYDNSLAHQIYAASDLFLMPSRFEPCGISQMIAQRYGALPIVRETGGLKDTVIPFDEQTGKGDGFSFTNFNAHDMLHVIRYALDILKDKEKSEALIQQAMQKDHSFSHSANAYLSLYRSMM